MSNVITSEGVMAVISAGKEDEDCLKMTYGSESKLDVGFASEVTLPAGHEFVVDEPETMPGITTHDTTGLTMLMVH